MTGAGYARNVPGMRPDMIREPVDPTMRLAGASAERSAAQNTDCAPSFSGRSMTQSTQAASSDLLENFRLLAAGGIAGAVSKTVTAPLARLTILYQVRHKCPAVVWALQGCQNTLGLIDHVLCGSSSRYCLYHHGPEHPGAINTLYLSSAGRRPQVNGLEAIAGVQGRIGLLQAFKQVIRREGVKALWKGNGVTIVHRLPYSAVNFWAYEQATQLWLQVRGTPSYGDTLRPCIDCERLAWMNSIQLTFLRCCRGFRRLLGGSRGRMRGQICFAGSQQAALLGLLPAHW